MKTTGAKVMAVVEVLLVRAAMIGILWLLFPLRNWGERVLGPNFNLFGKLVWLLLPILWLLVTGRKLADFGIHLRTWRTDVTAALTVYLPIAIASGALGFLPYTRWYGALIAAGAFIGALFWVARLLNGPPNPNSGWLTIGLSCILFGAYAFWKHLFPGLGQGALGFVRYMIFVGLAEEIWYRGFMQSRLNQVFERRWTFGGVQWGLGIIIAAVIFGLTHVLNGWNWETGEFRLLWWWGVWTTISGLVFAYIREKTGSVIAGAIVHGLPQALLAFFLKM